MTGPEQVHEACGRREVLELGAHLPAIGPVASKQLVQKGLRFSLLATVVGPPLGHKLCKCRLNLKTAAHGQMSLTESPA